MSEAVSLFVGFVFGLWLMGRFAEEDIKQCEAIMARQSQHIHMLSYELWKKGEREHLQERYEEEDEEYAIDWSKIGVPGGRTL